MALEFNSERHSGKERINPPLYHSRYVHLKLLHKKVIQVIDQYIKKGSEKNIVLADMGCGNLPYKDLLEPYIAKYLAIDLPGNPNATNFVNVETNVSNVDANSCDLVWSINVLEHVQFPDKYLAECYRILKPGGKLILSTHGQWMFHPDPIDFGRWTSQGLPIIVEAAQFKIIEFSGVMSLLSTSIQLFQDACLIHLPMPKFIQPVFTFIMQRIIGMSEFIVNLSKTSREYINKDACVFFVIATKNV